MNTSTFTENCLPSSEYVVCDTSKSTSIDKSVLTLTGITAMTYDLALELEQLTASHSKLFNNHSSEYVFDVLSTVGVYIVQNCALAAKDEDSNELTISIFQKLSWGGKIWMCTKEDPEDRDAYFDLLQEEATFIQDEVFNSEAGKSSFVARLQCC